MAASMTGYARVQSDYDEVSVVVTLRSVNHRFLDLQIRIPPEVEPMEVEIRRLVKKHIRRGQIQLGISLRWKAPIGGVKLDDSLIDGLVRAYREVAAKHGIPADPDVSALMSIPGALAFDSSELDEQRQMVLETALKDCLSRALEELSRVRRLEGEEIADQMKHRVQQLQQDTDQLQAARLGTIPKFRERLEKKLTDLLARAEPDPTRILQEAAVMAERADISEELERLSTHVDRLKAMLERDSEIGKQIDFLAQEMNRETNTILSKSTPLGRAGIQVTEIGLRLKSEIEKIREQAQNLE